VRTTLSEHQSKALVKMILYSSAAPLISLPEVAVSFARLPVFLDLSTFLGLGIVRCQLREHVFKGQWLVISFGFLDINSCYSGQIAPRKTLHLVTQFLLVLDLLKSGISLGTHVFLLSVFILTYNFMQSVCGALPTSRSPRR
jgi:hypothetical protein